eukprot:3231980-Amphidinium_carterae.1
MYAEDGLESCRKQRVNATIPAGQERANEEEESLGTPIQRDATLSLQDAESKPMVNMVATIMFQKCKHVKYKRVPCRR